MADAHGKNHDYHLVDPSPWPFVGSISAFVMAVGAVFWMHGSNPAALIIGFAGVLYTMFMWWRDVIKEHGAAAGSDRFRHRCALGGEGTD